MTRLPFDNNFENSGDEKLDKAFRVLTDMESVDTDTLRNKIYATVAERKARRKRTVAVVRICAAAALPLLMLGAAWMYYNARPGSDGGATVAQREGTYTFQPSYGGGIMLPGLYERNASGDGAGEELADAGEAELDLAVASGVKLFQVYSTLRVPKGCMQDIELADGTRVWLNSSSQLKFPSAFAGDERRVYLEGEAYFQVARDVAKPFIVGTLRQELTVLGTEFNISAYPQDPEVYTTLVKGSVALKSTTNSSEIVLQPGQQARLTFDAADFTVREVNTDDLMMWRNGIFLFEGATLEEAMRKLTKWYDMEFVFEDEDARQMVLRGSMPVQNDIATVLNLLEMSGGVRFAVADNVISIRRK